MVPPYLALVMPHIKLHCLDPHYKKGWAAEFPGCSPQIIPANEVILADQECNLLQQSQMDSQSHKTHIHDLFPAAPGLECMAM